MVPKPRTQRPPRTHSSELKGTAYEIFIGILSVMSIVNLVLVLVFTGYEALQLVLALMNGLFNVIFLIDFIYRFTTSEARGRYFFRRFGWADLLASVPLPQFNILRVFRLHRVYQLLRALGWREIVRTLIHDRANSTLMSLLMMGILVLQLGSLAILAVEDGAEGANIDTASDAIWYTLVTISTVGYGDQYPVTNAGRLIGVVIIIVGVGIFGTFTGYLANLFLGPSKKNSEAPDETAPDTSADAAGTASAKDSSDISKSAAAGVAAGAASGAVRKGAAHAASDGAAADDGISSSASEDDRERLERLLAQSERLSAELRQLLEERR